MFERETDRNCMTSADGRLIDMMKEVNTKGCVMEESRHKEFTNMAVLMYGKTGSWIDFHSVLISNGYEVTSKVIDGDKIVFTWKDKE